MLNLTTDVRPPLLAEKFCQFGLTEIVLPLVVGGLTAAGVSATTAGAIGAIAAPALVYGGAGALAGAGGELIKGGKPFKGALTGGKIGALAGGAMAAPGALAQAFPETMTSLGMGPAMASLGADGAYTTGPGGFAEAAGGGGGGGLSALTGLDPATAESLYGADALPGGAGAAPLTQSSGLLSGGLGRTLGLLSSVGQALSKPARPDYSMAPGPDSTAATRGPLFDAPLQSTGYLDRSLNQNYQPVGNDFYTYGQNAGQPNFFSNNQIRYPIRMAEGGALTRSRQDVQMARGGALGRHFEPEQGDTYVPGSDGGQEDVQPAMLAPGEFVLDAGTVSAIGDGNSDAGARRLEEMRKQIATDKGFKKPVQPKMKKSPLQYVIDSKRAA